MLQSSSWLSFSLVCVIGFMSSLLAIDLIQVVVCFLSHSLFFVQSPVSLLVALLKNSYIHQSYFFLNMDFRMYLASRYLVMGWITFVKVSMSAVSKSGSCCFSLWVWEWELPENSWFLALILLKIPVFGTCFLLPWSFVYLSFGAVFRRFFLCVGWQVAVPFLNVFCAFCAGASADQEDGALPALQVLMWVMFWQDKRNVFCAFVVWFLLC